MRDFFQLKANNTTVTTEISAGITTFFAMAYIMFVTPQVLSSTGMPYQAVFLATILASAIGTLIMALFANVPYAQGPGMGLSAFFTYTVCFAMGFTWQQALGMVFICGLVNILITVTNIRRLIIISIPENLQYAISGGIGVFIAYIGLKNAGFLQFTADSSSLTTINDQPYAVDQVYGTVASVTTGGGIVPALAPFNSAPILLALFGLILTIVMLLRQVRGGILLSMLATTILSIPLGIVDLSQATISLESLQTAFAQLPVTFCAAFGPQGLPALFADASMLPIALITIFAFCLTDMFDTIGMFVGTGRQSGIFSQQDIDAMMAGKKGYRSKMERALFADAIATAIGSLLGTSNVTTYAESAAGIAAGGRTGLTSLTTALLFLASILLAPVATLIPAAATAPVLIAVGIMMVGAFRHIQWDDLSEAVPAFFAGAFMALCFSISYGIAAAFIFYCLVKICQKQFRQIHPILLICTALFIINFIVTAL